MKARVARVGIVAKHGLLAASEHLVRLGEWLRERHIEPVYDAATALLTPTAGTQANRSREELPACVDLLVVLGGDGTLLAMADRTAQAGRDIPILGVNFGGLGFLTELRIDELFPSLEAVLDGKAVYDERLASHAGQAQRSTGVARRRIARPVGCLGRDPVDLEQGRPVRLYVNVVVAQEQCPVDVEEDQEIQAGTAASIAARRERT